MNKKRIYAVLMIFIIVCYCFSSNIAEAASIPRLGITSPSSGTVEVGGTITYTVNIYNDATSVTLKASDIRITGVTADISVQGSGTEQRTIVLSNIQGSVGSVGYISYIAAGVATNAKGGNKEFSGQSAQFTIIATVNNSSSSSSSGNSSSNSGSSSSSSSDSSTTTTLPPSTSSSDSSSSGTSTDTSSDTTTDTEEQEDTQSPTISIGSLSSTTVYEGDEISFEITYSDETEMGDITLNTNNITLYGFTADIAISGDGNTRTVTLSNIQGDLGGLKYIKIAKNTASDKAGNSEESGGTTEMFKLVDSDTKNKSDDWIENPNTGR